MMQGGNIDRLMSPDAAPAQAGPSLRVGIESELPGRVAPGGPNALFVAGWCFEERRRIVALDLVLGTTSTPAMAFALPRADLRQRLGYEQARLSGFWGIVPIDERAGGAGTVLALSATLEDGSRARREVARLEPGPVAPLDPGFAADREITICMATFEPPIGLFKRQVESIRAQTRGDWSCVISDDHSSSEAFAAIEGVVGDDPRFVVSRSERRLGFFHNFERALAMVPAETSFVALADQDDYWHRDKLEVLRGAIGEAMVAYCDARIVDGNGTVLSDTYWSHRRNNWTNFASLLLANSVSGGAALYRRDLLDIALPFPAASAGFFHDHWLAIVALAVGEIVYVDRPLYDYVQHTEAVLGHERAQAWTRKLRRPSQKARLFVRDPQFYYRHWRETYFSEYCRAAIMAQVLLTRCGSRLRRGRLRTLKRLAQAERSPSAVAWLLGRRLRGLVGFDETLRAERRWLQALLWRLLVERVSSRFRVAPRWLPRDAGPPPRV
jgi:glycosyltransferase involved in cell wall biosynthesis